MAACGVERDDNFAAWDFFIEGAEEAGIELSVFESSAADDELVGAPAGDFCGAGDGANATANADFEAIFLAGLEAELFG